jgi:hypothetical protein
MTEQPDLEQLRFYSIPYLEALRRAIPENAGIATAIESLKTVAWPNGKYDARLCAVRNLERGEYAFPMYCQKYCIAGLERDKELAERVIRFNSPNERAITVWTLGREDRVYGHCNFKKDDSADYDLKFCDLADKILKTNLRVFSNEFGVRRLLFLEESLLERFTAESKVKRLPIRCVLADLPER